MEASVLGASLYQLSRNKKTTVPLVVGGRPIFATSIVYYFDYDLDRGFRTD